MTFIVNVILTVQLVLVNLPNFDQNIVYWLVRVVRIRSVSVRYIRIANSELMIDSVNLKNLTKDSDMVSHDYKDCLRRIVC